MDTQTLKLALVRSFRNWRDHRAAMAELRSLAVRHPDLFAATARECGMSPTELRTVVSSGHGAKALMERMMEVFDLDPRTIGRSDPALMRDIQILCSRCDRKGVCRRELDSGTARENAFAFCPNAEMFNDLAANAQVPGVER